MNNIALLMEQVPSFYFTFVAVLGLLIGSFLNVVIYRLPIMMERTWRNECAESLPEANLETETEVFNLALPRSTCPRCHHIIGAMENIPVFSWLFQKGRCKHCQCAISARYPIVEGLTALCSVMVAWFVPFGWPVLYALILTWSLIALTFIDFDTMLLPDQITLPLLWLGLLVNVSNTFTTLESAVIGAVVGYLSLWSIYWAFKLVTGKEGMGYGDFKLFAVLGAWFGWQALPLIILLSSFVGAVIGIILIIISRHHQSQPFPFGPYLAAAGWGYLLAGDTLSQLYYAFVLY